jgi:Rieske Fe-S protein
MSTSSQSRREFIKNVGSAALAATLGSPLLGFEASAASGKPPGPMVPIILDLTKPDYAPLKKSGGAVKIPNPFDKKNPIIVSRISDILVTAFSSKCPHKGCQVELPKDNVIKCPCHFATFDATGKVMQGPADKDLFAFSANLDGLIISVKDREL